MQKLVQKSGWLKSGNAWRNKLIVIVLIILAACSTKTKKNWSKAEKDAFRESCVVNSKEGLGEEGSRKYCDCMLDKIETMYPDANDAGKITLTETQDMKNDCLSEKPAAPDSTLKN